MKRNEEMISMLMTKKITNEAVGRDIKSMLKGIGDRNGERKEFRLFRRVNGSRWGKNRLSMRRAAVPLIGACKNNEIIRASNWPASFLFKGKKGERV